jgi:uncharacterized membrane protein HdeD (DUF308 family)
MSMGTSPPTRAAAGELIVLGIVRLLLGVLALMAPLMAGLAIEIIIGILVLLAGIGALVNSFRARSWEASLFVALAGILAIVCGVLLLMHPLAGLSFLTILLAVYFVLDGITTMALGFRMSQVGRGNWVWPVISGLLSLLLGILIWAQWPLSGAWAIGVLVGINLLITGWTALVLGIDLRRA